MRIARVERSVAYNPTDQPTASGDWGAPGRALQGFGHAISGFSEALLESQNQEDDFKTKLALTNFQGQQQQDYENYKANYTGKPEDFQSGWNARYGQAWSEFAPTLPQNPRSQRNAALYGAQMYNGFNNHAQNTQLNMLHAKGVADVDASIGFSMKSLDSSSPDTFESKLDETIRGVNSMIDAAPPGVLTPADKARMQKQASDMAIERILEYANKNSLDPMPIINRMTQQWAADPALQGQRPEMPGGGRGVVPIGGSMMGKSFDDVPHDGGSPKSRDWGGPRAGGRHAGQDIPGQTGDPVFAVNGGTVLHAGQGQGYGNFVDVLGPDGVVQRFGHLSSIGVRTGDKVQPGATIGALGDSGNAKGWSHLHLEVFPNQSAYTKAQGTSSRAGWSLRMDPRQYYAGLSGGDVPTGSIAVDGSGKIDPASFANVMEAKVAASPLNGQVPSWGAKFGITTGTPREWARFFTMLQQQESGHRIAETRSDGSLKRFSTTPSGEQSYGPGQFKPGEYGLKTWADVNNPDKVADAYIKVAEKGKLFIYFGALQRPEETLQHGAWFDRSVAPRVGRSAAPPLAQRGMTQGHPGVKVASADGSVPDIAISAQKYDPGPNDSGIPRDPERAHFRLSGDDASKAKQLREIIASGRQDIVHQLDNQGNDVVAAKPSDKPVWHVNAVTKDEKGNVANALDKGDQFSGPGWAKDTITDWRAGRISAKPNSATANPNSGSPDMESANAASMNPMGAEAPSHGIDPNGLKYMKPSVQSEMMQAIVQKWPKFEAMQARFVKGFEDKVKATIEVANAGYDPRPEDMDQIRAVVARNPELMRKYGLDQIVAGLEGAITKSQLTRKMTPMALDVAIKRLDDHMVMGGATKEMLAQKKQLETLRDSMRKAVDADALTWAEKARIVVPLAVAPPAGLDPGQKARWSVPTDEVHLTPINFAAPNAVDQLRQRADVARGVGLYYGQAPQYFTKIERDHLKDVFRTGGAPMLATLGTIYSALGPDTPAAMREFVKDAPEAAMMGKLMADGGDRKLLEDAAKGLHLRVVEGDKFISRVDRKMAEPDVASLTPAMARTPGMIDPVIRMTNAVYEYQHRYLGKETFDLPLYRTIMAEVMGQTKGPDGVLYGGVGRQSTGWVSSANVVVPPSVRQDSFNALVGSIRDSDLPVIGSPAHEDGRPLTASEVRSAQWQSVGNGRYGLLLGTSPNEEPMYAWDHTRQQPFVLDLNPIMGTLRKRVPEIFRK